MQYSPYSATMNPYQTIYNNGGAAAYQPTWGYSDLLANALNLNSVVPLGYTRQQYNEERALAAESMWKSPLLGLGTFGLGTAVSYAVWGSPLQDLASKVGGIKGAAAFNVGFNNMPNMATIAQANLNLSQATENLRAGVRNFRAGDITRSEVRDLFESRRIARINLAATTDAYTTRKSLWGVVGQVSSAFSKAHEEVSSITGSVFKGIGSGVSKAFETGSGAVGGVLESQINRITGNSMSPWLKESGKSLFEMSESGWMAQSLNRADRIAKLEKNAAKLLRRAETVAEVGEAEKLIRGANVLTRRAETLRGGVFGGIKRGLASTTREMGTILKSGKGISGLIAAGGGVALNAGLGLAGSLASIFFNPLTMAEFYMIDQAVGYGVDTYQNYQTENEIKRNLMAKGNRILQYGFADGNRGLQGGLSTAQRDSLVNKIRSMAAVDAYKGDAFGLGADSLFGGHQRYSERLRELKAILNVGTDMGFFDMSRSMDDFEKKFEQTVKTVDKLSKLLKRTKGEIMTVMANVQNTEGIYDVSAIGASVRKKDFAARLSGVDLTTAMQEGAVGAQMSRQTGFSAALGASIMSENRILMNRAIRNGDIDREGLFRLGGEQGVLVNMQQSMLAMLQDESFRQELAMNYELDPRTGEYVFKGTRLNRIANASNAELKKMHDERYMFANGVSYSRRKYANVRGGKYYDISRVMQADLAKGKISQDTMNTILSGLILQRHAMLNPGASPLQREEALAQGLQEMGLDYEVARIVAHNQMGGYNKFKSHDEMVVAVDRYRDAYEKSGMNFSMLMSKGFDLTHSSIGGWSAGIGAGIGAVAGGIIGFKAGGMWKGGALVGAGVGGYAARALVTGTAVLANSLAPSSSLATSLRNELKSSFIKQGLNPNFVDTYLLGPSDEDKVASMKQGQFARKLRYLVDQGIGADSTSVNSGSATWKTLATGFESIGENSVRAKNYAEVFMAANNAAAGNVKNTLAGVLDITAGMTDAQLHEHGISKEDARLISDISAALKSGSRVDLTNIQPGQIQRIGEMLGVAFSVAGTDKLYENKQKLMNVLQIDSAGTTEAAYRNQILKGNRDVAALTDAAQNVGVLDATWKNYQNSGFMKRAIFAWGAADAFDRAVYQKYIQGVNNKADINYLENTKGTAWQSIRNRASGREWYEEIWGAVTDRWEYYISGDSKALTRLRSMAENLDIGDIELLEKATGNTRAFSSRIKENLGKYGKDFENGDVEYQIIQKMARGETLTQSDQGVIANFIYGLKANMGLAAVSRVAGKALLSKNVEKRENVKNAMQLLTANGIKDLNTVLKDTKSVEDFIMGLLDKDKGFTEDQKKAFFGDLSSLSDEEIIKQYKKFGLEKLRPAIIENLTNVAELASKESIKKTSEEKTMDAEGKNATVLTDQAMKDFKEGSLIIREVAGRLGFY